MPDLAIVGICIDHARKREVETLRARGVSEETIREVEASIRNVAQAVAWMDEAVKADEATWHRI